MAYKEVYVRLSVDVVPCVAAGEWLKKKKKTCISNKYTEYNAIQGEIGIYLEIVYVSMTYGKSVIRFIIVDMISPLCL